MFVHGNTCEKKASRVVRKEVPGTLRLAYRYVRGLSYGCWIVAIECKKWGGGPSLHIPSECAVGNSVIEVVLCSST